MVRIRGVLIPWWSELRPVAYMFGGYVAFAVVTLGGWLLFVNYVI